MTLSELERKTAEHYNVELKEVITGFKSLAQC